MAIYYNCYNSSNFESKSLVSCNSSDTSRQAKISVAHMNSAQKVSIHITTSILSIACFQI